MDKIYVITKKRDSSIFVVVFYMIDKNLKLLP